MKLEDQVCSLELAKKLKELGVNQKSYLWHVMNIRNATNFLENSKPTRTAYTATGLMVIADNDYEIYSAFTVAELGRMIPFTIQMKDWKGFDGEYTWFCSQMVGYTDHDYSGTISYHFDMHEHLVFDNPGIDSVDVVGIDFADENEANSRAKMLIWLIENKKIEIPQ